MRTLPSVLAPDASLLAGFSQAQAQDGAPTG